MDHSVRAAEQERRVSFVSRDILNLERDLCVQTNSASGTTTATSSVNDRNLPKEQPFPKQHTADEFFSHTSSPETGHHVRSFSKSTSFEKSLGVQTQSSRLSSLELRRLPPEILLVGDIPADGDSLCNGGAFDKDDGSISSDKPKGVINNVCLNPRFELRTQLLLSFQTLNVLSISFVVVTCILASIFMGKNVKEINRETFSQINAESQGRRARYLAESLHHRLFPRDVSDILYEAVQDRFADYPNSNDEKVPFPSENGSNVYPLTGPELTLEWNVSSDVDKENSFEHLQTRGGWFGNIPVSTKSAVFHTAGICNTSESDPTSPTYYPECSDANNDLSTGGVLVPSNLTGMLYEKGKDIVPFLKALYEYNQDIRDMGIFFANEGSGAYIGFPGFPLNGTNTYTSIGCDWMNTPNPYDPSRTIGTRHMTEKCRAKGDRVVTRSYNPMERAWCAEQALNPFDTILEGPSLDAFLEGSWLFTIGRSVYHRVTHDFIACVAVFLRAEFLEEILRQSRVYPNSEVTIARVDNNAVIASSAWNITTKGSPPKLSDLDIGLYPSTFEIFKKLVDFDSAWDPDEARAAYENEYIEIDNMFLVSHPFPPIPQQYHSNYRPQFLTIIAIPLSDIFEVVEDTNDDVDRRVLNIILFSTLIGCGGILLACAILLVMSNAITSPLRFMNDIAQRIVDSFGDDSPDAKDFTDFEQKRSCFDLSPNTEITGVVTEFKKMVSSFSGGSLMARTQAADQVEVANSFPMRLAFADLYKSRSAGLNQTYSSESLSLNLALEEPIHYGSNYTVNTSVVDHVEPRRSMKPTVRHLSSPLFLWIVALIVIPLLLTMIVIAVISMMTLTQEFSDTIDESESFLLRVEIRNLEVSTALRASFASQRMARCIRDLYLMSRYAGWILFEGVRLRNEAPAYQNVIEGCKFYDNVDDCPAALAFKVCNCSWSQAFEDCPSYGPYRHMPYVVAQSDSASTNGTRWNSNFPVIRKSPDTTEWWRTADLPGRTSVRTAGSSLYDNSFNRARAIAATSPVLAAIHRYSLRADHGISQFFGFHDDGMFLGAEGCNSYGHSRLASFQATVENGAAEINPSICPLGSYGFDPRCRDWYDSARAKYKKGIPLHVTPPYEYADEVVALSAASHLVDPRNGHYVGQALYDFKIDLIVNSLVSNNTASKDGGFALLITPATDNFGGDTVIGPGHSSDEPAVPVASLILPQDIACAKAGDEKCLERKLKFDTITASMKACEKGSVSFTRSTSSGDLERLYISYAPVTAIFLTPLDASDFARGATISESCVFSLALVETEQGIDDPFRQVEDELSKQSRIATGCLSAVIFLAVVAALLVSHQVAKSITEPMQYLLETIQSVEKKGLDQKLPRMDTKRGSKEVLNVSHTMETLYQVVRFANLAFFAGELEVAYRVLRDSLRVFRGMNNEKAISVACNNLGNILLVKFLEMKHEDLSVKCGLTKTEIITLGMGFYHEAIKLGEAAYDKFYSAEGWTPNCLDFMQHLSNRYFNRAMFLLSIKDSHKHPTEIERLGLRDLQIAKDMDLEIISQGEEVGWGRTKREVKVFEVGLTRVRGLLLLLEMGYPDDWSIEAQLDDLLDLLHAESQKENSNLFDVIRPVGRLQQIETEMMKYKMIENEIDGAAEIAIRSLYEDEYLLAETKAEAIQVMLSYLQLNGDQWGESVRTALKKWLEDSLDSLSMGVSSERQTSVSDAFLTVLSKSMRGGDSSSMSIKQKTFRYSVNERSCVTMEKF